MTITINVAENMDVFNAIRTREAAIIDWQNTKKAFNTLQQLEREKRAALYKGLFPNNVDTTETLELADGWQFKAKGALNYKLEFSTKENGDAKLNTALDEIEKTGNEGSFIAERLVKWKPELSVSEYKALSADSPIKKIIDRVLTITPGSPELELVPPK